MSATITMPAESDQAIRTVALDAVNQAVAEKIGSQKYKIWFKNSTQMEMADGYLKIGVPNLFIAGLKNR